MWYYDKDGNFVGDEDRPSQDDFGFIFTERPLRDGQPRIEKVKADDKKDAEKKDH
jgi:hypothetical protein